MVRHHIREGVKKQEIENWCNQFASQLLLPKFMLSQYLKAGGIGKLTERLLKGPDAFSVSERAFYIRISRAFPIAIFNILFARAAVCMVDGYSSPQLEEDLGDQGPILSEDITAYVARVAEEEDEQQRRFQEFDRTILLRRIYNSKKQQKFLLVVLRR